ncbi:MAG: tetratricopeptide repeat protein [Deltaproteobacteria bacterium]|nr:tetratricopeptide repeat protein [Deltaproteobacteria bacterium]MCB9789141.1 tetratricopeptide repeat protein [Deltaproteobacteria bacterium]
MRSLSRPRPAVSLLTLAGLALLATSVVATWTPGAFAEDPAKVPELYESSFAHEATGDIDRALNDVLSILRATPDSYVANLRAGWLYYSKGRYEDSVRFYDKASQLAPKAVEPHLGRMLPLMAAGRWAETERAGKRVLTSSPRNYLATSRMAYAAFVQGRYKEAERLYGEVLGDYPSDTEMMLGLGWTYVKEGRSAEARSMFEAVLLIRRDNVNAKAGLQAVGG